MRKTDISTVTIPSDLVNNSLYDLTMKHTKDRVTEVAFRMQQHLTSIYFIRSYI